MCRQLVWLRCGPLIRFVVLLLFHLTMIFDRFSIDLLGYFVNIVEILLFCRCYFFERILSQPTPNIQSTDLCERKEKKTNISRGNIYRLRDLSNAANQFDKLLNVVKSNKSKVFSFLSTLSHIVCEAIFRFFSSLRLFSHFCFSFSSLFIFFFNQKLSFISMSPKTFLHECAYKKETASQTKRNCKLWKEVYLICDRAVCNVSLF